MHECLVLFVNCSARTTNVRWRAGKQTGSGQKRLERDVECGVLLFSVRLCTLEAERSPGGTKERIKRAERDPRTASRGRGKCYPLKRPSHPTTRTLARRPPRTVVDSASLAAARSPPLLYHRRSTHTVATTVRQKHACVLFFFLVVTSTALIGSGALPMEGPVRCTALHSLLPS